MTIELMEIVNAASGPTGALALLIAIVVSVSYASWRILNDHLIPEVKSWSTKQDLRFEKIMKAHEDDRAVFKESIEKLAERIDTTDSKVDDIIDELNNIKAISMSNKV